MEKEDEFIEANTSYINFVLSLTTSLSDIPSDTWQAELLPYLPHINEVGEQLHIGVQAIISSQSKVSSITAASFSPNQKELLEQAMKFSLGLRKYLHLRRDVKEFAWLEVGLLASQCLQDKRNESFFLNDLGLYWSARQEKSKAIDYYEQSLELKRQLGDIAGEGALLTNLGYIYASLGEKHLALKYYEQGLTLAHEANDKTGQGVIYNNLGLLSMQMGDKAQALEYFQQALELRYFANDLLGLGFTLNNIGGVFLELKDYETASEYFSQALQLRQKLGDILGQAQTLNNIGRIYVEQNNILEATKYFEETIRLYRVADEPLAAAKAYNNLGTILSNSSEKQNVKALESYEEALRLCQMTKDLELEAVILNNLGLLFKEKNDYHKALNHYLGCLELRKKLSDRIGVCRVLHNIGALFDRNQDYVRAFLCFKAGLEEAYKTNDINLVADALIDFGTLNTTLKEFSTAHPLLTQALELYKQAENREGEATALYRLGELYCFERQFEVAIESFEACLAIHRVSSSKIEQANALRYLGMLYRRQGLLEKAIGYIEECVEIEKASGSNYYEADQAMLGRYHAEFIAAVTVQKLISLDGKHVEVGEQVYDNQLKESSGMSQEPSIVEQSFVITDSQPTQENLPLPLVEASATTKATQDTVVASNLQSASNDDGQINEAPIKSKSNSKPRKPRSKLVKTVSANQPEVSQSERHELEAIILALRNADLSAQTKNGTQALVYLEKLKVEELPLDLQAVYHSIAGEAYFHLRNHPETIANLEKSLQIYRQVETATPLKVVQIHNMLGAAYYTQNLYEKALEHHTICEQTVTDGIVTDRRFKVVLFANMGNEYLAVGREEQALEAYNKVLYLVEFGEDDIVAASVYWGMGKANQELGVYDKACEYYIQSLQLYYKLRMDDTVLGVRVALGLSQIEVGDFSAAEKNLLAARDIAEEVDNPKELGNANTNLAYLYFKQRNWQKAERYAQRGILYARNSQDKQHIGLALAQMGEIKMAQPTTEAEGRTFFEEGLQNLLQTNAKDSVRRVYRRFANSLKLVGRMDEAFDYLDRAYRYL